MIIIIISKLLVFPLGPPWGPTLACAFFMSVINNDFQIVPLIFKLKLSDNVIDVFLFHSLHNQYYKLNITKYFHEYSKFTDAVYRKSTFSSAFTNSGSFTPKQIGYSLYVIILSFTLFGSFKTFHNKIVYLKNIFEFKGYPGNVIGSCTKQFLG